MQDKNQNFSIGYSSQTKETVLEDMAVIGDIPGWLSGSLVMNGPAAFEVGATHFTHWLDGFAMLKKFSFNEGRVSFKNRFLQSRQYQKSCAMKKLASNEFATYANASLLGRISHSITDLIKREAYDNCNVNTVNVHRNFIAMTESSEIIEFNPKDLGTMGAFSFHDEIKTHLTSAHPQLDPSTGEIINLAIEVGHVNKYHIYKILPNSITREIIKTYVSKDLFYLHSFSITQHYVILFKSPLLINKYKLIMSMPFNDTLHWDKGSASSFILIDRRDGSVVEIEAHDPFICLHSINAYEKDHEVILDLICYENGNPYDSLYLSNLCSENVKWPSSTIRRYVLNKNSKTCQHSVISSEYHEFPRINYQENNARDYTFFYSNAMTDTSQSFFQEIKKTNVQTGHMQSWKKQDYYPGEAVFVKNPNAHLEDDGVLLSVALSTANQCSSLIVLDAKTMQQIAEVALPFHLPFGLHGNFYKDTSTHST